MTDFQNKHFFCLFGGAFRSIEVYQAHFQALRKSPAFKSKLAHSRHEIAYARTNAIANDFCPLSTMLLVRVAIREVPLWRACTRL
jgi:hypothetical protein